MTRLMSALMALCCACNPLSLSAASMTEVPVVGAMTTSSCKVLIRTDAVADVAIEYATNKNFANSTTTMDVSTVPTDDFTATVPLTGLAADTVHWYRVLVDDVTQGTGFVHKFQTFPASGSFTFAVFADVAPTDRAALAYLHAKNDGAAFALQIGDMDHGDPTTLAAMRAMHRAMKDPDNLHGSDFAQHILTKMALVRIWDDHDYGGNDEDKDFAGRSDAWQAFGEHWPTYARPNAAAGLWHSFTVADAEFFVLDLRSQRDPGTDTDDADKSMLDGDEISDDQKDWLLLALKNSTATWKFVVSTVTMNPTARPASTDHWRVYSTERDELASLIAGNDGIILLTGDLHTGGAIDDGTNSAWGVPELCVPHTNLLTGNTRNLGTWSEGVTSGAKGYGLVTVSSSAVVLQAYGANGTLRHSLTL